VVLAVAIVRAGPTDNKIGFEAWDAQGQCWTAGMSGEPWPETAMVGDHNNQLICFSPQTSTKLGLRRPALVDSPKEPAMHGFT
jgi:hypothetical protein